MHARVLRGAVTLTLAVVLAAAAPVVAQTPDAQATDAGAAATTTACQTQLGLPGDKITWTFSAPNQTCTRFFFNGSNGRGTYTFVGGAADVVTVTPRTGTSGTGESGGDQTLFAITSGAKSGQTTLTLRYDGPPLLAGVRKLAGVTLNWTIVIVDNY